MAHIDAGTLSLLALGEDVDFDAVHAWNCQRCGDQIRQLRRVVAVARHGDVGELDVSSFGPSHPSEALWERIDAQRDCEADPPERRIVWSNWGVAASMLLTLVVGAGAVDISDRPSPPDGHLAGVVAAQPAEAETVRLLGSVELMSVQHLARPIATGQVAQLGQRRILSLTMHHLPQLPGGSYFVTVEDRRTNAVFQLGSFPVSSARAEFPFPPGLPTLADAVVGISVAPAGVTATAARRTMATGAVMPSPAPRLIRAPGVSAPPVTALGVPFAPLAPPATKPASPSIGAAPPGGSLTKTSQTQLFVPLPSGPSSTNPLPPSGSSGNPDPGAVPGTIPGSGSGLLPGQSPGQLAGPAPGQVSVPLTGSTSTPAAGGATKPPTAPAEPAVVSGTGASPTPATPSAPEPTHAPPPVRPTPAPKPVPLTRPAPTQVAVGSRTASPATTSVPQPAPAPRPAPTSAAP
ncbi:MAG TPA: hypothetical protein VES01_01045 [Dermatophilaceae bacterium]|nr:hypothetical protein [Dermatophilaceae bacterium]